MDKKIVMTLALALGIISFFANSLIVPTAVNSVGASEKVKRDEFVARNSIAKAMNVKFMNMVQDPNLTDNVAEGLLLRFIGATSTSEQKNSMRFYLKTQMGIDNTTEQDTIFNIAESYVQQTNELYKQAEQIVSGYHPEHVDFSVSDLNSLTALQNQKSQITGTKISQLGSTLPANSWANFNMVLNNKVKAHAKFNSQDSSWTYAEIWASVRDDTRYASVNPQGNGNTLVLNGFLEIVSRIVYERNLTSKYHGVTINAKVQKIRTAGNVEAAKDSEVVNGVTEKTNFATMASYKIDDSTPINDGPYTGLVEHIPMCPDNHTPIPFPDIGSVGVSFLRFDYLRTNQTTYTYRHMHWSAPSTCDARCGRNLFTEEWSLLIVNERTGRRWDPSPHIRMFIPFGPYGCLVLALGYTHANNSTCIDSVILN